MSWGAHIHAGVGWLCEQDEEGMGCGLRLVLPILKKEPLGDVRNGNVFLGLQAAEGPFVEVEVENILC